MLKTVEGGIGYQIGVENILHETVWQKQHNRMSQGYLPIVQFKAAVSTVHAEDEKVDPGNGMSIGRSSPPSAAWPHG
jgi:hypothetical protein